MDTLSLTKVQTSELPSLSAGRAALKPVPMANIESSGPTATLRTDSSPVSATGNSAGVPPKPAADDKKAADAKQKDIEAAVNSANVFFQQVNRELRFQHSEATDSMVIQIVDQESGKLIHQFPSEQMLNIAKDLEKVAGLLFKGTA